MTSRFPLSSSYPNAYVVYSLLDLEKKPPPVYQGNHDVDVLFNALKVMRG